MTTLKRCISIFMLSIGLLYPTTSHAETTSFLIQPRLPENQVSGIKGYFNLNIEKKDSTQVIYIRIKNFKEEPLTLRILKANALTTQNGGIQYVETKGSPVSMLTNPSYALSRYIDVQDELTLAPNEQKDVPISITMPKHKQGTYLGGILFGEQVDKSKEKKQSIQVHQQILYGIAIQLNFKDQPKMDFSYENTEIQAYPSVTQLLMTIKNDSATLLKNIKGSYRVENEQGKTVLKGEIQNMDMAPKTQIKYPVTWEKTKSKEGNYNVKTTFHVDGKVMTFSDTFQIGKKEIEQQQINKTEKEEKTETITYWVWIEGIVIVVLLVLLLFKKKKKNVQ